jgi:hypothetical protein
MDYKKYSKLIKLPEVEDYDLEGSEQYAELIQEIETIKNKVSSLKKEKERLISLANKYKKEYLPTVWCTKTGDVKPIHKLDNSHIQNIVENGFLKKTSDKTLRKTYYQVLQKYSEIFGLEKAVNYFLSSELSNKRLLELEEGDDYDYDDVDDYI